jgi:anaerobic selenocysteine-containing dehydrogenase
MSEQETKKGLSRRDFIKSAVVGVGAVAVAGLGATGAKAIPRSALPGKWEAAADVVVVGYGGGWSCNCNNCP